MLMLRSIVPAINLENGSKQLLFKFFCSFQSSSAACAANNNSEKENTIRGSFAGIHVSSRGIEGFTDQRTAFTRAQSAILQGPDFNLRVERVERARKIPYSRS